jgi:prophage regulatory protein
MTDKPEEKKMKTDTVRQMLNVDDVLALVPVSRRTLLRWERKKRFPVARYIGNRKVWFADELGAWQDDTPVRGQPGPRHRKR